MVIPLLRQNDAWLEQSIMSALNQSIECEVIVVGCPETPPPNLEVVRRLSSSHRNLLMTSYEKASLPGQLNTGFLIASAERIGLLLSDDWLDASAVELCLPHDVDIVSTGHSFFGADGITEFPDIEWIPDPETYAKLPDLERKASYLKHFFLFRKSKLCEIGGADEAMGNFPGIDDYDMIWTLLEHQATVALVPDLVYTIRDHEGDRLTLKSREESVQGLRRILHKHGIDAAQAQKLIESHARWYGEPVHLAYKRVRGLPK
jgi:hypothetical protein